MVLTFYILDETLEPLLSKNIRFLPSHDSLLSQFRKLYNNNNNNNNSNSNNSLLPPVICHNGLIFAHIHRDSLFFVSLVGWDTDVFKVLNYLEQFYQLLKSYFEVPALDKTMILDNLILVTELVDECVDFGVIQITDSSVIKDYIRIRVNLPSSRQEKSGTGAGAGAGVLPRARSGNGSSNNENNDSNRGSDSENDSDSDDEYRGRRRKSSNFNKELGNIKKMVLRPWKSESKSVAPPGNAISMGSLHHHNHHFHHLIESGSTKSRSQGMEDNYNEEQGGADNDTDNDNDYNDDEVIDSNIAKTTTAAVSWRAKGIHYSKNEFFLDVVERVQYLVDFENSIVKKNFIHGEIICRCYLSGMPTLKVAINKILDNDRQFLPNCKFHQCVSLGSIENGRDIEFLPPDGHFVLCKYELKRHINDVPMIKLVEFDVKPNFKKFKLKLSLRIEPHFKRTNSTTRLNLKVPLTSIFKQYRIDLSKPIRFKCDGTGRVLFNVTDDFLLWEVGNMKGGHGENQLSMATEFALFNEQEYRETQEKLRNSMGPPPLREGIKLEEIYKHVHEGSEEELEEDVTRGGDETREEEEGGEGEVEKPTDGSLHDTSAHKAGLLLFDFEIPYCTQSGINIEYLKIEEKQLKYQSFPWIRYKTVSDEEYGYMV